MFEELNIVNQSNNKLWRVDASQFPYANISELKYGKTYMVCGIYMYRGTNNNSIKSHGILSIIDIDTNEGFRVNLPVRYNHLVKQITSVDKYKNGINEEKCGVIFSAGVTKQGQDCYNVKLVDL